MKKVCKNCDYYVNKYGYGQCYGQKNAPRVEEDECCEDFKERVTTYREQMVGETDEQYAEYKRVHDNLFNNLKDKFNKAEVTFIKNDMINVIKQAVKDEFKYRASHGRTNYSMEEVIYIVNEVIDEVAFENK